MCYNKNRSEPKKSPIFRVFPPLEDRKMNSSNVKVVVIVFALLFSVGFVVVGCKQKPKAGWVNTASMPGRTFSKYVKHDARGNAKIVYLGQEKNAPDVNFGPRDVSFNFVDLK